MKIIIVCSGESARGFVPPNGVIVIAVNDVIRWINRANYYFTLDPDYDQTMNLRRARNDCEYVVAYNKKIRGADIMLERVQDDTDNAVKGYIPGLNMRGKKGLQELKHRISTGNSGYGALNFAYHLGFEKLLFIGLDAGGGKCDGIPCGVDDYKHLDELFASAEPQVRGRVVNASLNSTVNCFPKMSIEDGLAWLLN